MAIFNLKKLTDTSWIASSNNIPLAFISNINNRFLFLSSDCKKEFNNLEEIEVFLGGKLQEQVIVINNELDGEVVSEINGFPVKHQNTTIETDGDRPVYLRGKTQHAAGYWAIKFSKRYVPAYCPLLKTVDQYQCVGPFTDRLGMMSELSVRNRAL